MGCFESTPQRPVYAPQPRPTAGSQAMYGSPYGPYGGAVPAYEQQPQQNFGAEPGVQGFVPGQQCGQPGSSHMARQWACEACTFLNHHNRFNCVECGSSRPSQNGGGFGSCAQQNAAGMASGWNCHSCTLANAMDALYCHACGAHRPEAGAAPCYQPGNFGAPPAPAYQQQQGPPMYGQGPAQGYGYEAQGPAYYGGGGEGMYGGSAQGYQQQQQQQGGGRFGHSGGGMGGGGGGMSTGMMVAGAGLAGLAGAFLAEEVAEDVFHHDLF